MIMLYKKFPTSLILIYIYKIDFIDFNIKNKQIPILLILR